MTSTSLLDPPVATDLHTLAHAQPACGGRGSEHGQDAQTWAIRCAQSADVAPVKAMFRALHAFNASLDPRFALSETWERHFDAAMQQTLRGEGSLCLIAHAAGTGPPYGFALATVHRDSGIWHYHEWVDVEALYVEDAWRGCGLAEALLGGVCAWAEGIGHSVVQLYVTASNERAIRFYRHEGFGQTQAIMRKVLA
jgi:GNAT superfamily N-acetyltransferase